MAKDSGVKASDLIVGPASSVADSIATFNGTTGKIVKDSGIKASDLIVGPATSVADNIATFSGTTGKIAKDSGIKASDLIAGPASSTADNLVSFNGTTGKLGKDSGVKAADVVTGPAASVSGRVATFSGTTGKLIQDGGTLLSSLLTSGGALGTPSSGSAANLTGLPVSTGISGLAANMAAFLAGGTSAQLAAALTNETGSGSVVFGTSPTISTPTIDTINLTGGQIAFPITDNPSSNANTLDDYEEGTFTPAVAGMTNAGTGTYLAQTGKYTKIGNLVCYSVNVVWTAHTGTGSISLVNFPFTSAATGVVPAIYSSNLSFTGTLQAFLPANTTIIQVENVSSGSGTGGVAMDTSATIRASGQYFTI
ncbi:MAG: hypothetical protein J0I79_20900 [Mesorhizobium sp.]|uniref:hypothetical protein n=1 Tax=Mesorhizobium sp. TaxID=1871066 RepID=UPI001AD18CB1|nr:hypothetical protein [Mesorhizobium sp.]MBN9220414.1 hypothetical protein [Mesorhizobium sp.]